MTQWSAISQARGVDETRVARGLGELARSYWRPLYLYLRKRGEAHADACDSVQGFFEYVLGGEFLKHVDREGGKFRSYLLRSLERWRSRRRVRQCAQKRGGQAVHVPLEGLGEMEHDPSFADASSPEDAFDRRWAVEVVLRAVARLRDDYERRDRAAWFDALRPSLPGGDGIASHAEVARSLGASEGAVKKAAFDLRKAFGAALREEIRMTVTTREDAEEELRHLVAVMAGR